MIGKETTLAARQSGFASQAIRALETKDVAKLIETVERCPILATQLIVVETKANYIIHSGLLSAFAVKNGWAGALDVLWKHGDRFQSKISSSDYTIAAYAARKGKLSCLRRMLKLGLDVNAPVGHGALTGLISGLRLCDHKKGMQALDILLEAGADPYAPYRYEQKCIALAAVYEANIEVSTRMLTHSNKVDNKDPGKWMDAWMSVYTDNPVNPDHDLAFLEALRSKGLRVPSPLDLCRLWWDLDDAIGKKLPSRSKLEILIKWSMDLGGYNKAGLSLEMDKLGNPLGLAQVRAEISADTLQKGTHQATASPARLRF